MRVLLSMIFFSLLLYCSAVAQQTTLPGQHASFEIPLKGWHQSIGLLTPSSPLPPITIQEDTELSALHYSDNYYKLGCTVQGFKGYFNMSNWTNHKEYGDGGVDVTGAPNPLLVEGANSTSVILTSGSSAFYTIAIPADGYVTFDWGYIGGSNLLGHSFSILINGQVVDQIRDDHQRASFFSSSLQAGDELSLVMKAAAHGFEIKFSNFEFISNAIGVFERTWTAVGQDNARGQFTQLVSVNKPEMSLLLFPEHYDDYHQPSFPHRDYQPEWTGYPVFDLDGNHMTTDDQYPISMAADNIGVKWKDELMEYEGRCIVYRHWTITDFCGSNVLEHTQIIKITTGCPESIPGNLEPHLIPQRTRLDITEKHPVYGSPQNKAFNITSFSTPHTDAGLL
jgi:hypothetical protein